MIQWTYTIPASSGIGFCQPLVFKTFFVVHVFDKGYVNFIANQGPSFKQKIYNIEDSVHEWTDSRCVKHLALFNVTDSLKGVGVLMEVQSISVRVYNSEIQC